MAGERDERVAVGPAAYAAARLWQDRARGTPPVAWFATCFATAGVAFVRGRLSTWNHHALPSPSLTYRRGALTAALAFVPAAVFDETRVSTGALARRLAP